MRFAIKPATFKLICLSYFLKRVAERQVELACPQQRLEARGVAHAANLRVLNQMVEGFTMSHNRRLTDLDELVKMKLISRVPPAPAGKKFVIDSKGAK